MTFKALHNQHRPLIIGNVWDVPSSKIAQKSGLQAIGTSSAAIAAMLGYKDGEEMNFAELKCIVRRIAQCTTLPLSVDLESGYSRDPKEIAKHIMSLAELGIVGINIEDSVVAENRVSLDPVVFAKTLNEVNKILTSQNIDIFINVRIDTFILNHSNLIEETKRRMKLYQDAGADGFFIPSIESISHIKEIVEFTKLPVNVMCMPNLPDFDTLTRLGVKRISMGNFLFDNMYVQFGVTTKELLSKKSFKSVFLG